MMVIKSWNISLLFLLFITCVLADDVGISVTADDGSTDDTTTTTTTLPTCTWENRHSCDGSYQDSNLFPMAVPLNIAGHENMTTFYAYVDPDVSTFYNATVGSITPKEPPFSGLFAKFINLSSKQIKVYYESNGERSYIADIAPFNAGRLQSIHPINLL